MIRTFRGTSENPVRCESGTIANGYMIGHFAIDAPEGVKYPDPQLILITHAHYDHICGLSNNSVPYACSKYVSEAITQPSERATLCTHLGFPNPRRPPAKILQDGEIISGEDFSIEVISTPGHSSGAFCFYVPEQKALFSGDTVFGSGALPSITLPDSNPKELLDSYKKLSNYAIEKIYPGHGKPFSAKGYIQSLIPLLLEIISL